MCQPNKITILRVGNLFTVLVGGWREILCADQLTFDEALGYVARLMCPTDDAGNVARGYGKPLFLSPPKHPDAAGDAAPVIPAPTKTPVSEGDD
jgi:hypothetical protein